MTEQHPGDHLAALPQGGLPDQWLDAIHARHAAAEGGAWHLDPEPHTDPDTVRTNIAGWNRRIGILKFGAPYAAENQRFVLHAHQDVGALLAEIARLTALLAHDHHLAYHQGEPRDNHVNCGRDSCQSTNELYPPTPTTSQES